ncbi:hypothetical protein APS67_001117 [Streptomyces sp. AVP053U2]|nr:hypothetical protein APS67_001117 [Streptomyces sp. AVP053U2]
MSAGHTRPLDLVTRPVEPYGFEELGEITAQACPRDGLLDSGGATRTPASSGTSPSGPRPPRCWSPWRTPGRVPGRRRRAAPGACRARWRSYRATGRWPTWPGPARRRSGCSRSPAQPGAGVPGRRGGPRSRLCRPGAGHRGMRTHRAVDPAVDACGPPRLRASRLRPLSRTGLEPGSAPGRHHAARLWTDAPTPPRPGIAAPPTTQDMGLPTALGTRCMLMLAVAAGESGANPELSRNGVLVRFHVSRVPARA